MDNVDDFSYVGHEENFKRLSQGLVEKLEITKTIADEDHAHEVKYFDVLTCGATVFSQSQGDPKHRNILIKHCSGVDTRLTMSWSGLLKASAASKVRRAIARTKYMSLDRADLLSAARVAWQYTSAPRKGSEMDVKRVFWCMQSYFTCGCPRITTDSNEDMEAVEGMPDINWPSDTETRHSCSGG